MNTSKVTSPDRIDRPEAVEPIFPEHAPRRIPGRWKSVRLLAVTDLHAIWQSWLCRGFFLVTLILTVLELKGMQAEQKAASQMLEAIYVTYILIWMHGVVFIAGNTLAREQDCLNDAILSRGLTRGEYFGGKLIARSFAILLMLGCVIVPSSFWAIRHDKLIRTETGYVISNTRNTKVEAWDPKKVFAEAGGTVAERKVEQGDSVHAGDILAQLDDRPLFDEVETERRNEENAKNEVQNSQRRFEDAQRAVTQAEDALERAERSLIAKDLLSKAEQADREMEIRSKKREIKDSESRLRVAQDAIVTAQRSVETAQARVRDARKRFGHATITAPVSGYVTEVNVQRGQPVAIGTQLFAVAPLDEYQVKVPIYRFDEFKKLKSGLPAYVRIEHTEFKGTVERLGATTQPDRWGRDSNFAVVRFKGNGTLGLLGLNADVRLTLPPGEEKKTRATALWNAVTGHGSDDLETRTSSVTASWMWVGVAKVFGCALMLVSLTLFLAVLFRSALIAVLAGIGLWHVSNLLFDFVGLPDLSYLEIVRTMDKVLSGVANPFHEMAGLAWLFGFAAIFAGAALTLFVAQDPPK